MSSTASVLANPWPLPGDIRPNAKLERNLWQVVALVVAAAAGGLIMLAVMKQLVPPASMKGKISWIVLPATVLMLYAVIIAHELGHLIGGKLVGMQFQMFFAGPVLISKDRTGIKLALNRNWQMWGGAVALSPKPGTNLGKRLMATIAAGPFMSLLLGGLLIASAMTMPAGSTKFTLVVGGMASCLIGAITLIPNTLASTPSDGRQLLDLIRGGTAAAQHQAMMRLVAADNAGTRPADWPIEDLRDLQQCDGVVPLKQLMAHSLTYFHWRDKGDLDKAASALRELLVASANITAMLRPYVAMEVADFLAHHTVHLAIAKAWFAEGDNKRAPAHLRHSARAAIAYAEGDFALAATEVERAKTALSKSNSRGCAIAAAEWLDALSIRYAR